MIGKDFSKLIRLSVAILICLSNVGAQSKNSPFKISVSKPTLKAVGIGCGCQLFECGLPNREQRVLGGGITDKVEYPWLAYLTYRGKLYCGASLINNQYLVTAGHCIHRVDKEKVVVNLGKHHRTNSRDSEQEMKIAEWWIHPEFNRRTFQNDIGVIKLQSPVSINKFVRPVCMPHGDGDYVGEFGTVVGWGKTAERGAASELPREIKVPIITNDECKLKKYNPQEITDNMFCAGYDQGKVDACQGDSGGPLMLERKGARGQSYYELTGIVSWGQGCGRAGYPGVYTRVGNYLSFVKKNIPSDCYC